ncbi:MAG: formate dehydrogenase accessory sulfurtransferase FdhD [Pseudomonas sp.]|nr:formate dehydrogenase accessory sulfurtransferase FdhD [Pseudomonas sp.]MDO9619717.1 formate dehydrogenase accessory sulfurtransferase FdhD [Pseudomonas sp.]MDP2444524.1 formate dehydrogenase accessory sulfurtransferase FdhD [Pseudomonas sp.]MDZ4335496.1 formate dehydrogenase accessory sulfurtransferase FdhD [Pseudomonas sp.]
MPRHAPTSPPPSSPALLPAPTYSYVELAEAQLDGAAALASETALAISYNGISHSVMMVSPSDLEDFIYGFSLSAGLIDSFDEIYDIRLQQHDSAISAEVQVSNRAFWALKQQRRTLAGNSGCGLCGVEALEQALPHLQNLPSSPLPAPAHLQGLRQRIQSVQTMARHSGAVHAALFVDAQGQIRLCREDIGRHNALDKLLGALHREGEDLRQGFAVVTSRCSLELIHKALRAGIGTLVSLSAPTSLSVQWARQHNLNLIHIPQQSAPRVYSPAAAPGVARS